MKNRPDPQEELSPHSRFVDAALHEQARLGSAARDEALVREVLLQTVENRGPARIPTPAPRLGLRTAILVAGSVAAVLALIVTVLDSLTFENGERNHTEIQLVVTRSLPAEPVAEAERPGAIRAEPSRYGGEIELVVSSRIGDAAPLTTTLKPSEWTSPLLVASPSAYPGSSENMDRRVEIDSDRVEQTVGALVYSGDVELRYHSLRISADEVRLATGPGSSEMDSLLLAENARLVSESGDSYPISEATAGIMEIDPVTGLIRLREIERLETLENGVIEVVDHQEVSITAAGYAIERGRRR